MSKSESYRLTCPFCNRDFQVEIGISKQAYKDQSTATINVKVEDVRQALPQDVLPNLNVALSEHTSPNTIHIVPKMYLGKENFYKVTKAVKAMRGDWVSQGKHSYWWVPAAQKVEI